MPGDVLGTDVETINYIRSESAFNQARKRGYLEVVKALIMRQDPYLLSLSQIVGDPSQAQTIYRGLRNVPMKDVVGSAGRQKEFSRCFFPLTSATRQKERWRTSYTMSISGIGYTPIEVCKVGRAYFVVNGHHRVSVARYLNWKTIEAYVSELALPEAAMWTENCRFMGQGRGPLRRARVSGGLEGTRRQAQ